MTKKYSSEIFENYQMVVLMDLQRVLKRCHKAGIRIRGQCGDLVAWNNDIWKDVSPGLEIAVGKEMIETFTIMHGGAYVDSGADDPLFGKRKP